MTKLGEVVLGATVGGSTFYALGYLDKLCRWFIGRQLERRRRKVLAAKAEAMAVDPDTGRVIDVPRAEVGWRRRF